MGLYHRYLRDGGFYGSGSYAPWTETVGQVKVSTPKGVDLDLEIEEIHFTKEQAVCAVRKDSGDDPDVTNGIAIYSRVSFRDDKPETEGYIWENEVIRLHLTAGEGVGIVTKPGLACEVGKPAINPVPREMIFTHVERACRQYGFQGSLHIEIFIPQGIEISKKTFIPVWVSKAVSPFWGPVAW